MAGRRWVSSTNDEGQLSVAHSRSPLEVTMRGEGVYEIEFAEGELGLVSLVPCCALCCEKQASD